MPAEASNTTAGRPALLISRWKLYDRNHRLDTVKIGRRRFVTRDALVKLIDELNERADS